LLKHWFEEEVEIAETLVSRNNATVDIPLKEDLKKLAIMQNYMMTINLQL
jgi:hypothetical protein